MKRRIKGRAKSGGPFKKTKKRGRSRARGGGRFGKKKNNERQNKKRRTF